MGSTNPSYTSRLTKNLMAASIEAGVAPLVQDDGNGLNLIDSGNRPTNGFHFMCRPSAPA